MAIKFQIKARFTDAVLFEAELDASFESRPESVKLGEAVKAAVKDGANLRGADLYGANLSGAILSGANLRGAKIGEATITTIIARVTRTIDPFEFLSFATDRGVIIRAGCRTMSPVEFRIHVANEYPDTPKAEETLAILDFIEARATKVCAVETAA